MAFYIFSVLFVLLPPIVSHFYTHSSSLFFSCYTKKCSIYLFAYTNLKVFYIRTGNWRLYVTMAATAAVVEMAIMVVAVFCIVIYVITRKNIKQWRRMEWSGGNLLDLHKCRKKLLLESRAHTFYTAFSIVISDLCASRWESSQNNTNNNEKWKAKKKRILKDGWTW